MTDWAIGDLALCVNAGIIQCPYRPYVFHTGEDAPTVGTVITVASFGQDTKVSNFGCRCRTLNNVGLQARFIKVTPEEDDEFDREVIELMKGGKVKA